MALGKLNSGLLVYTFMYWHMGGLYLYSQKNLEIAT